MREGEDLVKSAKGNRGRWEAITEGIHGSRSSWKGNEVDERARKSRRDLSKRRSRKRRQKDGGQMRGRWSRPGNRAGKQLWSQGPDA
jgi:hypothetical protein